MKSKQFLKMLLAVNNNPRPRWSNPINQSKMKTRTINSFALLLTGVMILTTAACAQSNDEAKNIK